MSRRLLVLASLIVVAVVAFFVLREHAPAPRRPTLARSPGERVEASDQPSEPWDPESVPAPSEPPTTDDIDRVQRLLEGDPDAGISATTGVGLQAALTAGVPREHAREALDIAAQRVIAAALAGCARSVHITAPVAVSVHGEGEFIETMSSTGPGEYSDCTRSLFGVYLPHDPARREFTVPVP